MPLATAESAVSRLLNSGRCPTSLRGALAIVVAEGAEGSIKDVETAELFAHLDSIEGDHATERFRLQGAKGLQQVYAAATNATSLILNLPTYPYGGDEAQLVHLRQQVADRTEIYNPGRRAIYRIWCFGSEQDAYEWLFYLVHDSVAIANDPARDAEFMLGELEQMQEKGLLEIKLLHSRACLVHCLLVNIRGVKDVSGFVWFYDAQGYVSDPHALEGHYLRIWNSWIREVEENNPNTVRRALQVKTYRDEIQSLRRNLRGTVSPEA